MGTIANLGMQAAGNAVDAGMGMILGGINDRRQLRQQGKLQELQMKGSKEMMDYQMQKEYDMWLRTNYSAQKQQIKEAGLNPGLLYGMSGGGGVTTGNASASVSGGNAPAGGGEVTGMMGMGLQRGMQAAQMDLIEAQAENVRADTTKKLGVDTEKTKAEITSLTAGVENTNQLTKLKKVETDLLEIEKKYKDDMTENEADEIYWKMRKAQQDFIVAEQEAWLNKEVRDDKVKIMEANALEAAIRVEAAKLGVKIDKQTLTKLKQDIRLGQESFDFNKWAKEQELKQIGWDKALTAAIIGAAKKLGVNIQDALPEDAPKNK